MFRDLFPPGHLEASAGPLPGFVYSRFTRICESGLGWRIVDKAERRLVRTLGTRRRMQPNSQLLRRHRSQHSAAAKLHHQGKPGSKKITTRAAEPVPPHKLRAWAGKRAPGCTAKKHVHCGGVCRAMKHSNPVPKSPGLCETANLNQNE